MPVKLKIFPAFQTTFLIYDQFGLAIKFKNVSYVNTLLRNLSNLRQTSLKSAQLQTLSLNLLAI